MQTGIGTDGSSLFFYMKNNPFKEKFFSKREQKIIAKKQR